MRVGIDARKAWDGGIGRYIRNLFVGLVTSGEVAECHAWFAPGKDFSHPPSNCVKRHEEAARPYGLWEQVALRRKVNRHPLDLFHAPHYIVPVGVTPPLIVTIHDVIHLIFPKSFLHKRFALFQIGIAVRNATTIITPSDFSRRELIRYFPEAGNKTVAILHGLEPSFFAPRSEEDERIRRTLNLPERFMLYVGNHKAHKNLGWLLRVCRQIFADFPDVFLCVTGDKEDEGGRLFQTARWLGLEARVKFLGILENEALQACYRNALCFVFPSLYEGFGFPPLEAMACGTPVVAFRVASLPEVVGEGGILVPKGDGEEFGRAVVTLLKDGETRRQWGEKGREQARRFRWEEAVAQHLHVYRRAMTRGSV